MFMILSSVLPSPCYVGPRHHGMVCPWLVRWRRWPPDMAVTVNVLKKQLWTADKGWSFGSGSGEGLTTPYHKKKSLL